MPKYILLVQGVTVTGHSDLTLDELLNTERFLELTDVLLGDTFHPRARIHLMQVGLITQEANTDNSHLDELQAKFNNPISRNTTGRY